MRRLIVILAAGLVLLGSLTSCMKLDKEMDYTFGYNYNVNINDLYSHPLLYWLFLHSY